MTFGGLNNYAFKSSEESRKVYQLTNDDVCKYDLDTYMVLSNSVNYDYCKHKHILTVFEMHSTGGVWDKI
jgi:uncharacterized protein with NRDE domain